MQQSSDESGPQHGDTSIGVMSLQSVQLWQDISLLEFSLVTSWPWTQELYRNSDSRLRQEFKSSSVLYWEQNRITEHVV